MNTRSNYSRKLFSQQVAIVILLTVVTIFVYRHVGTYEFVNYDDPLYITANRVTKDGLTLQNIAWAFTTVHASNWHPITWLSHMLDIELFGLNAGGHHLMNLFIHICNTLLLYLLFRKGTGNIYKSAILAAFFALHPLHVESVAWIAERKDLLCAFFWLLAMIAYSRYAQRPSFVRYFFVFVCVILGSLSKSMMVTFPFALLLFDYWPLNRHVCTEDISTVCSQKKSWLWLLVEKIPMIVVSIVISIVALLTQSKGGAMADTLGLPIFMRIANALVAYIVYLKKMIWPGDLSVLYPLATPSLWLSAASFTLIVGCLMVALVLRKRHAYLLFGFLWYLGTLVPVIGIIQVGSQAMADRYTYIPSIGIFAAIVWGVSAASKRLATGEFFKKTILSVVTATILILMMLLSSKQVRYWQNSITLMSNAVQVTKNNYVAHENLGLALVEQGLYEEALYHFKQAVAINPYFAKAYLNIGSYYMIKQDYQNAITFYKRAIALDKHLVKAYYLTSKALIAIGDIVEAETYSKKARQIEATD